ncbi:hypothetical protein F4561_000289 [Lipingzhangella halophila]|uniref:CopC domain-containing protein n=1 Tax=Lipingzhangella halophila TaxID=1783352 RepID=A0A7W7RCM7_9ACTN|nr:copper resistance CopC family protein [Lipingzhangella halophila]MBB4929469.1 hypothetical protein [Lipingzhangella halophila]
MQTPPAVRRSVVLIPATTAALLLGLAAAPAALAHNTLISSSPEDGETLDSAPEEVTLTFSDEVQSGDGTAGGTQDDGAASEGSEGSANAIVVTGPGGETYEEGEVRVDGDTASIGLGPLEAAGEHTIAYRVVSADGHPVEDELTFTLSQDGAAVQSGAGAGDEADGNGGGEDAGDAAADDSDADQDGSAAPANLMSTYGPIGGVVVAIALVAMIIILIVRMRNRPEQGGYDT